MDTKRRELEGENVVAYTHNPQAYGHPISQRRLGATVFHHYDALGSTDRLTDANEDVDTAYLYRAFGEQSVLSGAYTNPFTWVGRLGYYRQADLDNYWLRARIYSQLTGRFLSRDPMPNGNLYIYPGNSPLVLVDPSGQWYIYGTAYRLLSGCANSGFSIKGQYWESCPIDGNVQDSPYPYPDGPVPPCNISSATEYAAVKEAHQQVTDIIANMQATGQVPQDDAPEFTLWACTNCRDICYNYELKRSASVIVYPDDIPTVYRQSNCVMGCLLDAHEATHQHQCLVSPNMSLLQSELEGYQAELECLERHLNQGSRYWYYQQKPRLRWPFLRWRSPYTDPIYALTREYRLRTRTVGLLAPEDLGNYDEGDGCGSCEPRTDRVGLLPSRVRW